MKIASAKSIGVMPVYDLSVSHEHHSFTHSSGVIMHNSAVLIANRPVNEFIPLQIINKVVTTQYNMGDVEAAGGLKMDFLNVNSLGDLQEAIGLIQSRSGLSVPESLFVHGRKVPAIRLVPFGGEFHDLWDLPEDQSVFRDICESKTETVFQLATSGALQWLEYFNQWRGDSSERKALDTITAVATFTALNRPGPLDANVEGDGMSHNMLVEYARRARVEKPIGAVPLFDELVPETYGILVFQEQLQKIYQAMTGCSGPEAEEFRRNVAKKKMDKINKAYEPWLENVGGKYGIETAKDTFAKICTFGNYGFNKSHAICYTVISYACAFLKHHYPLEWWTAVLRNANKKEITETFWRYCGDKINFPEIGSSGDRFDIVGQRIQAPLSLLMGIGPKAHERIMQLRPYNDIEDFCAKLEKYSVENAKPILGEDGKPQFTKPKKGEVAQIKMRRATNPVNKSVAYDLIIAGALDSLFPKEIDLDGTKFPVTDLDKLKMYEIALAKSKGKKKPEAIDPEFEQLTPIKRYQRRRLVLEMYSEPLMGLIAQSSKDVIVKTIAGSKKYHWPHGEGEIPFLTPEAVRVLDEVDPFPGDRVLWGALPGYVVSQRQFSYQGNKEACEFILDVDGVQMKYVKWPERKGPKQGSLDLLYKEDWEGAVVVASISKYKADRPFSLEKLTMISPPISTKKDKKDDDTQQE